MRYWIGPWQWITDESVPGPSWNAPAGTVAVVDLRNATDAGRQGTTGDRPIGFFAGPDTLSLPLDYARIGMGDCREIVATAQMRNLWEDVTGYRPGGAMLVDLLWDQLTNGADVDGESAVAPLVPRADGTVELLLGGHSVVKAERFGGRIQGAGRWNATLRKQLRAQFARQFDRRQHVAEKVLGNWVAKYGLGDNWQHLVPPKLRAHTQGPRKPETTYSDVISGRTEALNAGNWHYYTTSQNFQVVTAGTYLASGSGYRPAEYISSLSSDDMYSEFEWVTTTASSGPATRTNDWNTTTPDFMHSQQYSGQGYITKIINGGATNLANAANTHAIGNVDRLTSDGSGHTLAVNSVDKVSVTDTSIVGYVQAGFMFAVAAGTAQCKNWAAADIAAGGPVLPALLEGGMMRGGLQELSGGM
jgi:hypothetical protein